MNTISNKQMYSVVEAMIATGLGKTSIYKEIKEGKLVAKKFGSRTLIPASSIETWITNLPEKTNFSDF